MRKRGYYLPGAPAHYPEYGTLARIHSLMLPSSTPYASVQVDSPDCSFCSSTQMASSGIAPPTPAEAAHQASRTELHRCGQCGSMTRFPRYNDVAKLLETRWVLC